MQEYICNLYNLLNFNITVIMPENLERTFVSSPGSWVASNGFFNSVNPFNDEDNTGGSRRSLFTHSDSFLDQLTSDQPILDFSLLENDLTVDSSANDGSNCSNWSSTSGSITDENDVTYSPTESDSPVEISSTTLNNHSGDLTSLLQTIEPLACTYSCKSLNEQNIESVRSVMRITDAYKAGNNDINLKDSSYSKNTVRLTSTFSVSKDFNTVPSNPKSSCSSSGVLNETEMINIVKDQQNFDQLLTSLQPYNSDTSQDMREFLAPYPSHKTIQNTLLIQNFQFDTENLTGSDDVNAISDDELIGMSVRSLNKKLRERGLR